MQKSNDGTSPPLLPTAETFCASHMPFNFSSFDYTITNLALWTNLISIYLRSGSSSAFDLKNVFACA